MDSVNEAYQPEAVENSAAAPDKYALDARIQEAEPVHVGAADQMLDTPQYPQGNENSCLLRSAEMAEAKQTGVDPGLEAYKGPATQEGIYDAKGVNDLEGFVDVMNERPGIQAELSGANGPDDIKQSLDSGESVIACVDANTYYNGVEAFEPGGAGHAVVMTGADVGPDGKWEFAVNDPNNDLPGEKVSGDRFLPAWENAGKPMISVAKV